MSTVFDARFVSAPKWASRTASGVTFLIGCLVLFGWTFDVAILSTHANCYVTKPVDLVQFLKVVKGMDKGATLFRPAVRSGGQTEANPTQRGDAWQPMK